MYFISVYYPEIKTTFVKKFIEEFEVDSVDFH